MVKEQIKLIEKRIDEECDEVKKLKLMELLREAKILLIKLSSYKADAASGVTTDGLKGAVLCAGLARF